MADNFRTDLAIESRQLRRRATWCGVVFALGVLLTSLNFLPPVSVHYQVRSEAVVEASKLPMLQRYAQDQQTAEDPATGALTTIKQVEVLDQTINENLFDNNAGEPVILIAVKSVWTKRCTEESHQNWLQRLTESPARQLNDTETARANRLAKWELAAAEHYAAQHAFLNSAETQAAVRNSATLTKTGTSTGTSTGKTVDSTDNPTAQRVSATLASYVETTPESAAANNQDSAAEANAISTATATDTPAELLAAVDKARTAVASTEIALQQQLRQSTGLVRMAAPPEVDPAASTIPLWMAASVLIVGLASGVSAGRLQHRWQSGGAYDPTEVAQQLARDDVPVAGVITIANDLLDETDWIELASRTAGDASRRAARQLTRLSEWGLGFWCLLIFARVVLDPLWRNVLVDSPLAAFGRILAGMP